MKTKTLNGLFKFISLENPGLSFPLDKTKFLIGSDSRCDILIEGEYVSSLHCFLVLKNEGVLVKDLCSENGVYINDTRIHEDTFINNGDILTLGHTRFSLIEIENQINVVDVDAKVNRLTEAVVHTGSSKSNLVFVDGEFCDIKFDDDKFSPIDTLPVVEISRDRVDIDETDVAFDLGNEIKGARLEVINYLNGVMMDVNYIALKDGDYFISATKKAKNYINFNSIQNDQKLFTVQNGKLKIHEVVGLSVPHITDPSATIFLTAGVEQLSLRVIDHAYKWHGLPLFFRDRLFFKESGKVFASLFLPILFLLFISLPTKETVQEIAVIYKLPEEINKTIEAEVSSEATSQEVTEKFKPQVSPTESKSAKSSFAKTAPAAPSSSAPAVAAAKAYEFNSDVSLDALAGDLKFQGNGRSDSAADDFKAEGSDKGRSFASGDVSVSKFNGGNGQGNEKSSYGSKGLASKKGFDTSYMETKTVVLGSMDPELLRKILREYIPQFRHCYQQELVGSDDSVKGIIDLNFTISANGKVAKFDIQAKDARFSRKGVNCMGQVLSLIEFPRPKGGGMVDVKQPLNFFSETQKI
jgi:pSer/pThr/pTyr-binding forkhead associated (FHA) protein